MDADTLGMIFVAIALLVIGFLFGGLVGDQTGRTHNTEEISNSCGKNGQFETDKMVFSCQPIKAKIGDVEFSVN